MKTSCNRLALLLLLVIFNLMSCSQRPKPQLERSKQLDKEVAFEQKWQQWVDDYDKSRRSDSGWLSLAGLYWLNQGDNKLGSQSSNHHIFPSLAPEHLGVVNVNGDKLVFEVADEAVRIDGKKVKKAELLVNKTQVTFSSFSFHVIKRERGFAIRLKNKLNPSIKQFKGTHFYPYNKSFRVKAKLIPAKDKQTIKIATVYNTVRQNDLAGILEFEWMGKTYRLEAVSYGKDTPMSLMFVDETSQETTYGAGRYLSVEWPQDNDITIIDFNYAYNPPCAITSFATCPLPPQQNRLDFAVAAGELFSGH